MEARYYVVESHSDLDELEAHVGTLLRGDYHLHGPMHIASRLDGREQTTIYTQALVHFSALPPQVSVPSPTLGAKDIQAAVDRHFAGRRTTIPIKPKAGSW